MDWVTDSIAIGNYLDTQDAERLARDGVRSIFGLDGKLRGKTAQELGVERLVVYSLVDGPGNDLRVFRLAIDTLRELVEKHPRVLVHCHAGRSRSPILVAGYLMTCEQITPEAALGRVARKRQIQITDGLEELLYRL